MEKGNRVNLVYCIWCYFIFMSNSIKFAHCLASFANGSHSWKNNKGIDGGPTLFNDNSIARTALYVESNDANYPPFGFGFITNQKSNLYILAIYMGVSLDNNNVSFSSSTTAYSSSNSSSSYAYSSSNTTITTTPSSSSSSSSSSSPVVVWCANRDHPVRDDATLELTSDGDLVLRDVDGSFVWSTNTSGRSVMYIDLQVDGNLVLLDRKRVIVWESKNYPSDTIFFKDNQIETLSSTNNGTRIASSVSTQNYSTGKFYVTKGVDGFHAFVNLNPPQEYRFLSSSSYMSKMLGHSNPYIGVIYIRLDPKGHLNVFKFENQTESYLGDLFEDDVLGDCAYPTTCEKYGVCSNRNQCACPAGSDGSLNYFKSNVVSNASSGCSLVTPFSCPDNNRLHSFLELPNVTYLDSTPTQTGSNIDSCKRECLNNCSCKAVFFRYHNVSSIGNCSLPTEILTLKNVPAGSMDYNAIAFVKVINRTTQNNVAIDRKTSPRRKWLPLVLASLIVLVLVAGACFYGLKWRRKTKKIDGSLDVFFDKVIRFPFETLKRATLDFQTRLGRGGFGSVFQGTLEDGTKIAVKRLDSLGQGKKEFEAEVKSIGSLHHFNLVKLIGFCDEGMNRLLVYEYMCNGSLDKWIFNSEIQQRFSWPIRRHIIEGVAAGLQYLHEHCQQNVIHFDIKSQNILLDKDFNVKISDFGLAKMVDRDQGQVLTVVRGTPGYMAPELIKGHAISVKVDVYSFGVLVLEIVCGRRNVGSAEGDCLTGLVRAKAEEDQLSDLIDKDAEDMQQYEVEAVNMMKMAICCLQPHFNRPTMSKIVKVLQNLSNIEADCSIIRPSESEVVLSGPR